jgi:hypothetical protein
VLRVNSATKNLLFGLTRGALFRIATRSRSREGQGEGNPMHKKITGLTLCALLFAHSYPAQAQQPKKVPRIGYLVSSDPATESTRSEAIRLALRELGYIEGQNIAIEYRMGRGSKIGGLRLRPTWCASRLISSW